jgi:hypothetical protein
MKFVNFIKMGLVVKKKIVPFHMEVKKLVINLKCVQSFNRGDVNMEKLVLLRMEEQTLDESLTFEIHTSIF